MAKRLGSLRRRLLAVAVLAAVALLAYLLFGRDTVVAPHLASSRPVAAIGSGADAVAVAGDGALLRWLPPPEEGSLPRLPLVTAPEGRRLAGRALDQVRVLAAAPPELRPYLGAVYYGESGVDVELTAGIELRFGEATQVARKWRAAAAVLADPALTSLDYVDVRAPRRPATGGSGHALPPIP